MMTPHQLAKTTALMLALIAILTIASRQFS